MKYLKLPLTFLGIISITFGIVMIVNLIVSTFPNPKDRKKWEDTIHIPIPMENDLYSLHKDHRGMTEWLEQHPGWIVVSASQGDGYGWITYTIKKKSE